MQSTNVIIKTLTPIVVSYKETYQTHGPHHVCRD